jgi:rubrerythrin
MQDKFEEWFYQTANEDRPVVWFDKLVSEYHSSVEGWIRHAYKEGYKQAMKDTEND